jgi:hypothetical protein
MCRTSVPYIYLCFVIETWEWLLYIDLYFGPTEQS